MPYFSAIHPRIPTHTCSLLPDSHPRSFPSSPWLALSLLCSLSLSLSLISQLRYRLVPQVEGSLREHAAAEGVRCGQRGRDATCQAAARPIRRPDLFCALPGSRDCSGRLDIRAQHDRGVDADSRGRLTHYWGASCVIDPHTEQGTFRSDARAQVRNVCTDVMGRDVREYRISRSHTTDVAFVARTLSRVTRMRTEGTGRISRVICYIWNRYRGVRSWEIAVCPASARR
jgi:hypothetical protein